MEYDHAVLYSDNYQFVYMDGSLAIQLIKLAITKYSELDRKDIAFCCVGGVFGLFVFLIGLLIVIGLVFDLHVFR